MSCGIKTDKPRYAYTAKKAGKSAIGDEKRKDVSYVKLIRNYIFVPIVVETFQVYWKEIGKMIKEKTGSKNSSKQFLFQSKKVMLPVQWAPLAL